MTASHGHYAAEGYYTSSSSAASGVHVFRVTGIQVHLKHRFKCQCVARGPIIGVVCEPQTYCSRTNRQSLRRVLLNKASFSHSAQKTTTYVLALIHVRASGAQSVQLVHNRRHTRKRLRGATQKLHIGRPAGRRDLCRRKVEKRLFADIRRDNLVRRGGL